MNASRFIARFDSASAMLRAVGRFLHGRDFPALGTHSMWQGVMPFVNRLPSAVRRQLYIFGGWTETVSPRRLGQLNAEAISRWVVGHYPRRPYPAAMIGSSNGAAVHLCCALGIPWLPQTLLVPVRRTHVHPDEMRESLQSAVEPAERLLAANPDLAVHHMHDPNQDRLMVRKLMYFRIKRLRLGEAYERFLEECVAPGGTLFLIECELKWPTTQVADRHVFQPGALGGAAPEEYLDGGPRVEEFLQRHGSHRLRWDPPEPDGLRPEAEWGFEPALRDDVERLARRRGLRVRRIVFEQPEDFSPFVADFYRWWYRQRGIPANRLVAESFILMEPWWVLRTGSVPFWTAFAVEPSAEKLEAYLDGAEPYDHIHAMLFSHGVASIGYAAIERWRSILQRSMQCGSFLGVDERTFPRDFAAFVGYHQQMKALPARFPLPGPLPLERLDEFLRAGGDRYRVRWS